MLFRITWFRITWFFNNFKVPALLENQVEERTCSDSEYIGSSECSDTDSEEQGDHARPKKHTTGPDVDKKVSNEIHSPFL